jgi:hypothetical protein
MATGTTEQRQRRATAPDEFVGDWIDSVKWTLDAQNEMFVSSLRAWRKMTSSFFEMYTNVAGAATDATVRSTARAAESAREAASTAAAATVEVAESQTRNLPRPQTKQGRPQTQQGGPQAPQGLDALAVEHLDRLAKTNDVKDYPHGGTKADKVIALAAAGVSPDAPTVEQPDRVATSSNVDDDPDSGAKRDKIVASKRRTSP